MILAHKPIAIGLAMGLAMLWMLHGALNGATGSSLAIVAFVLAHVVIALVIGLGAIFATRLSPRLRQTFESLHRPTLAHVFTMLFTASLAAVCLHFLIHRGL